jgi:hypothetical protein
LDTSFSNAIYASTKTAPMIAEIMWKTNMELKINILNLIKKNIIEKIKKIK